MLSWSLADDGDFKIKVERVASHYVRGRPCYQVWGESSCYLPPFLCFCAPCLGQVVPMHRSARRGGRTGRIRLRARFHIGWSLRTIFWHAIARRRSCEVAYRERWDAIFHSSVASSFGRFVRIEGFCRIGARHTSVESHVDAEAALDQTGLPPEIGKSAYDQTARLHVGVRRLI